MAHVGFEAMSKATSKLDVNTLPNLCFPVISFLLGISDLHLER